MNFKWVLVVFLASATSAHASGYTCELTIMEKVPAKVVLQQKTGRTVTDPSGNSEDEYKDVKEKAVNDLQGCQVSELGYYPYFGDFRVVMESCQYTHPKTAFSIDTDGGQCTGLENGTTHCFLASHESSFDLVDKTLGEGKNVVRVTVAATIDKDPKDPGKNVLHVWSQLARVLKMGSSDFNVVNNDVGLNLPANGPFFDGGQSISPPTRNFDIQSLAGDKVVTTFYPEFSSKVSCVRN